MLPAPGLLRSSGHDELYDGSFAQSGPGIFERMMMDHGVGTVASDVALMQNFHGLPYLELPGYLQNLSLAQWQKLASNGLGLTGYSAYVCDANGHGACHG